MKNLILLIAAAAMAGCTNAPQPIVQNSNSSASANERSQTAIAHGPDERQPPAANSTGVASKWSQSGDPVDTTAFDATIAKAEKAVADKPDDAAAKKALSEFYLARANALTGARQYASALGDYRRTLKYDPANKEALDWVDQILKIYQSMKINYPAEGEEPPPLPFKKDDKKKAK